MIIPKSNIWQYEKDKKILIFISQTGHSKPLINNLKEVAPRYAAKMEELLSQDNSMYRVIELDRFVFVIYKKHYNTRDNAAQILEAYNALPEGLYKTTVENANILAALKDKPNIMFYETSQFGKHLWK